MGGPELRDVLLAQVQMDLARCRDVLTAALASSELSRDMNALRKTAHEVKGLSVTLGADSLADTAEQAEQACTVHDRTALAVLLPMLEAQTQQAGATLAALAAGD